VFQLHSARPNFQLAVEVLADILAKKEAEKIKLLAKLDAEFDPQIEEARSCYEEQGEKVKLLEV
jgi:hypothetical protein